MATTWTIEAERTLLSYLRDNPSLWQPRDPEYYKRDCRQRKLEQLILLLKSCFPGVMDNVSTDEIKRKVKNIRSYFNRELKKVTKKKTGTGADEIYISKWPLYNDCLFLKDVEMDKSQDSLSISEADDFIQEANFATDLSPLLEEEGFETSDVETVQSHPSTSAPHTSVPSISNPPSKKRKRQTQEEARLEVLQHISQSLSEKKKEKKEDDKIEQYCASLSEPLRALSLLRREEAKLEIQKIIVRLLKEDGHE